MNESVKRRFSIGSVIRLFLQYERHEPRRIADSRDHTISSLRGGSAFTLPSMCRRIIPSHFLWMYSCSLMPRRFSRWQRKFVFFTWRNAPAYRDSHSDWRRVSHFANGERTEKGAKRGECVEKEKSEARQGSRVNGLWNRYTSFLSKQICSRFEGHFYGWK